MEIYRFVLCSLSLKRCRPNIEGRKCDHCRNGYFNFPHCQPCRCSIEGTTSEICDQEDERCFCKKNVDGPQCDRCVDGTYNLQSSNPEGCTKCFCFGKTTRCDRAYLRPFNVSMLKDVSVNTIKLSTFEAQIHRWPIAPQDLFANETTIETEFPLKKDRDELIYFGVLDYLEDQKNHLTAYGGSLTYTLYSSAVLFAKALTGPDVILEGKTQTLVHHSYEQPANEQVFHGSVKIVESSFTTLSGAPVTRDQFMHVLNQLNAIYIRANYWDEPLVSQLSDAYLVMADQDDDNYGKYEELSVERCSCPAGYIGNSCEDCAPGYYRDPNGPHGGYCIPCQCNGHADTCDLNTGVCIVSNIFYLERIAQPSGKLFVNGSSLSLLNISTILFSSSHTHRTANIQQLEIIAKNVLLDTMAMLQTVKQTTV